MPDLLKEKRILITGGGTGLGRAMAERFLQLGAAVYICGRRAEVVEQTAGELARIGSGQISGFGCDVRDMASVEAMLDAIWSEGPLNVLVNNAAGNILARTEDLSLRAWEAVVGIVLNGTINMTVACGRRWLAARQSATVLNVSTTYAASGSGSAYVVPSAVAKAGVMALTRSLAVEWGPRGIRLNGIAPGPIPTEGAFSRLLPSKDFEELAKGRNPVRRFGTTEEFANVAAFLVSDGCTYINGEIVVMDGGEWLQGAGEFSYVGQQLTEEQWEAMRPKKKAPTSNSPRLP
ncbi:MAG TPA: SDR family oxidoreductase [Terriglobales bacterium]|nr:SDR family oxidoreductase [Terriglobales bacterium]